MDRLGIFATAKEGDLYQRRDGSWIEIESIDINARQPVKTIAETWHYPNGRVSDDPNWDDELDIVSPYAYGHNPKYAEEMVTVELRGTVHPHEEDNLFIMRTGEEKREIVLSYDDLEEDGGVKEHIKFLCANQDKPQGSHLLSNAEVGDLVLIKDARYAEYIQIKEKAVDSTGYVSYRCGGGWYNRDGNPIPGNTNPPVVEHYPRGEEGSVDWATQYLLMGYRITGPDIGYPYVQIINDKHFSDIVCTPDDEIFCNVQELPDIPWKLYEG